MRHISRTLSRRHYEVSAEAIYMTGLFPFNDLENNYSSIVFCETSYIDPLLTENSHSSENQSRKCFHAILLKHNRWADSI